jgi:hypothetical protein
LRAPCNCLVLRADLCSQTERTEREQLVRHRETILFLEENILGVVDLPFYLVVTYM